jgi:hypothetical protein
MDVELHERRFANVLEAVHLACLDHEDVAGAPFELFAVHDPPSATFLHELDFVVRVPMRSGPAVTLTS